MFLDVSGCRIKRLTPSSPCTRLVWRFGSSQGTKWRLQQPHAMLASCSIAIHRSWNWQPSGQKSRVSMTFCSIWAGLSWDIMAAWPGTLSQGGYGGIHALTYTQALTHTDTFTHMCRSPQALRWFPRLWSDNRWGNTVSCTEANTGWKLQWRELQGNFPRNLQELQCCSLLPHGTLTESTGNAALHSLRVYSTVQKFVVGMIF